MQLNPFLKRTMDLPGPDYIYHDLWHIFMRRHNIISTLGTLGHGTDRAIAPPLSNRQPFMEQKPVVHPKKGGGAV
ncbi:hypothetical protein DKP78_20925 [Enterococcus faecium]|nr:hypothetical protein DKP78_20925 [Enterococcus faecium]